MPTGSPITRPLIHVDGITVRLGGRWLLEGLTWRIESGQRWVIAGPNGSGKTTLARAIAGLLPVVGGFIRYPGFPHLSPGQAIAYVGSDQRRALWQQEQALSQARSFAGRHFDTTTVGSWLRSQAGTAWPPPHTDAFLKILEIPPLLDKPLPALSTGEMSRLLLARSLTGNPCMLILDEPFEGLDESSRHRWLGMLDRLADSGLALVLIVHRRTEIPPGSTHLLRLEEGGLVDAGPLDLARFPETAKGRPAHHGHSRQAQDGPVLIEMQGVCVRYGDTNVLDDLSWTVRQGQHWSVRGPNGAGKSTLLKLITGECLQVYANQIRLFGRPRGSDQTLAEIRRRLGVVSMDLAAAYQKKISVREVVCSGFFDSMGLYQRCDTGQLERVHDWLQRLGLDSLADRHFNHLSQGQRQMILIARAMVKAPQLLILDEPCAGLDSANRRRILGLLSEVGDREGTSLIYISHHTEEIPAGITHQLTLQHGRAVGCGPIG